MLKHDLKLGLTGLVGLKLGLVLLANILVCLVTILHTLWSRGILLLMK